MNYSSAGKAALATSPSTQAGIMLIRPYQQADESAVIALWDECKLTRPWNDPRKDIARKLNVQRELFLVGEVEGRVMASIMGGYDGHRGWVNYLAVQPGFQRRGYGHALMQAVEQGLLAMGCPKINLQVRSNNESVLAFYRHIGYVQDEVVSLGRRLIPDT
jgi:ribosomal protein S18 acetylase RimI-like enzyme